MSGDLPWIYPKKRETHPRYLGKYPLVVCLICSIINGGTICVWSVLDTIIFVSKNLKRCHDNSCR